MRTPKLTLVHVAVSGWEQAAAGFSEIPKGQTARKIWLSNAGVSLQNNIRRHQLALTRARRATQRQSFGIAQTPEMVCLRV